MTSKPYGVEYTRASLHDRFQRIRLHKDYQEFCSIYADFFDVYGWEREISFREFIVSWLPPLVTIQITPQGFSINMNHPGAVIRFVPPSAVHDFEQIKKGFGLSSIIHYKNPPELDDYLSSPVFIKATSVETIYLKETIYNVTLGADKVDGVFIFSPLHEGRILKLRIDISPNVPIKLIADEIRERIADAKAVSTTLEQGHPPQKPIIRQKHINGILEIDLCLHNVFTVKYIIKQINNLIVYIRHNQEPRRNRFMENQRAYKAYEMRLLTDPLLKIALKLNIHPPDDLEDNSKRDEYRKKASHDLITRAYELIYSEKYTRKRMQQKIEHHLEINGLWQLVTGKNLDEEPVFEQAEFAAVTELLEICDTCNWFECPNSSGATESVVEKINNPHLACDRFNKTVKSIRSSGP